jgi:pimeloyl-ACP methyl ester carboxylesterase
MFVHVQDEDNFAALPRQHRGWTDPLVVYQRGDGPKRNLVVFVHGLGGSSDKTWGQYPEFAFQAGLDADVGLLDYESGLRRKLSVACRSVELGP